MLYAPEAIPNPAVSAYLVSPAAGTNGWYRPEAGFVPGGTIPLSQVRVGETSYRLRRPVQGVFVPIRGIAWEFWVEGFSPLFVGQGPDAETAFRDWRDLIHEAFQDLYRKRPFEMTADEQRQWRVLEDLIDVAGYHNETPVLVRQIGQVTQARPQPRQITWVDGSKESRIDLSLLPDEFAAYKPGQWFEAVVERDPRTWQLRRVRYVQRTPSLPRMSDALLNTYWRSLPTTATLAESTRDWTRR